MPPSSNPTTEPAMYSRHTRARASPTEATAASQLASRLAIQRAQRPGVVLAQRLDVTHLEAGPLHRQHALADVDQLAVGNTYRPMNDVRPSRDPPTELMAWLSSRPHGSRAARRVGVVLVEPLRAHVLRHPDRRDGVELLAAELAIVLQADLDAVLHAGLGDALARQGRLGLADRDADDGDLVVGGGVDGHGFPAAPDVEQAPAGVVGEPELAADQVVLGRLPRCSWVM